MKNGEVPTKKPPLKLAIHFHTLKPFIDHSSSTKAHPQIKAVLSPIATFPPKPPPLEYTQPKRCKVVTCTVKSTERPKPKLNKKCSSESTNELTETLRTAPTTKPLEHHLNTVIRYNLLKICKRNYDKAQIENIDKIIYNDRAHVVALFKDFLVYDDIKELIQQYYKSIESTYFINKYSADRKGKKCFPSTISLGEYKILKRAKIKKEKIRKIKEGDKPKQENESTFFRTAFMNSLAKEDLSNSLSKLPANSLECSNDDDSNKMVELLKKLDGSIIVKKKIELNPIKKIATESTSLANPNKVVAAATVVKKSEAPKKTGIAAPAMKVPLAQQVPQPAPLNKNKTVQKSRPTTTMQKEQKAPSPSPYYFITPRTTTNVESLAVKKETSVSRSTEKSIEGLIKATFTKISKNSKYSDSTLLKLLSESKSGAKDVSTVVPKKSTSRKNNYFAIYDGKATNKYKTISIKPCNSSREAYQTMKSPNLSKASSVTKKIGSKVAANKSEAKSVMKESADALLSKSRQIAKLGRATGKNQEKSNMMRNTPDLRKIGIVQKFLSPRVKMP